RFILPLVAGSSRVWVTTVHTSCAQRAGAPNQPVAPTSRPASAVANPSAGLMPLEEQNALVKQYCSGCHNDSVKSGGMTLTTLELAHLDRNPELAEKVIRKLKTGLMPPSTVTKRPDGEIVKAF